ncbi:hypothetical protein JKP88DRAFT_244966 [Tribonema minus]|uniref:Uncharacterized protein n=1 Tax=Tribonema minus TaxID=303371 RepID=A0A835Z878_9STRA|nr:hypothetical protein JKP88DRAFT_244966 [Tribonema minus]
MQCASDDALMISASARDEVQSSAAIKAWTQGVIRALDDGSMTVYCDMQWRLCDGSVLPDISAVYARFGNPLASLTVGDSCAGGGAAMVVDVEGFLKQPDLFRMVRVYCHTGITVYGRTESPMALYKRYECCDFFNFTCCRDLLHRVIVERLDVHSALQLFDVLSVREFFDNSLTVDVTAYVKNHFGETSRSSLSALSIHSLPHLCALLAADDVNTCEAKLLSSLYAVCDRLKPKGGSASQVFMQPNESGISPWQCVRVLGLKIADIVAFRTAWPQAFSDTFCWNLAEVIETGKAEERHLKCLGLCETSLRQPRKLTALSCYPRNIPMSVHGIIGDSDTRTVVGPSSIIHIMWQERHISVAYACVAYTRGRRVQLPPYACNGSAIQLTAIFEGTHMHIEGGVDINASQRRDRQTNELRDGKTLTVYVVHFRHGRWNKGGACIQPGRSFHIAKLITLSALEGEGYKFDPTKYPVFAPGSYILIKMVITDTAESQVQH